VCTSCVHVRCVYNMQYILCILHDILYSTCNKIHGTRYFISAIIITVICDNGVKVVIRSERLIIRNGIFIKNGLIESPALSQDCFGAALNQVYRSISLRCHYGVVTVKQSQLFSLR